MTTDDGRERRWYDRAGAITSSQRGDTTVQPDVGSARIERIVDIDDGPEPIAESIEIMMDDARTGLCFDLDHSPDRRLVGIHVVVPWDAAGTTTWMLAFDGCLPWLPHAGEAGTAVATTSIDSTYTMASSVTNDGWELSAQPLDAPAPYLTSFRLLVQAEPPAWPWRHLRIVFDCDAKAGHLAYDVTLTEADVTAG